MIMSWTTEELQEMCGLLAVFAHTMILFNLYFGMNIHSDFDPKSWDIPQLVAATGIFIYLGAFLSTFQWRRLNFDPHHHIENTFYALATTLPTLSVIFSCIGIGSVFWETEVATSETVFIVVLYTLNVLFISIFSHILGLWSAPPKPKRQPKIKSRTTKTPPPTPVEREIEATGKLNDADFIPKLSKAFPG